jgi:HEAT repeat protein
MRRNVGGLLCLFALAMSCSERPTVSHAGTERGKDAVTAAVRGFDPGNLDASLQRLNDAAFAQGATMIDVAPLLTDADPIRRWAAVYVAAILADAQHTSLLLPVLRDPDPALQVMAAGALAGHGVVDSIPVLINGLGSDAELPYDDPPRPVSDLAAEALRAYTGQAFVNQEQWSAWWGKAGSSLTWNGKQYVPR